MDKEFKEKYEKYKVRVKLWEKSFQKKHGRVPSKYDIREAPKDVQGSYKMYYKLKTSFLESTLEESLADDGFNVLEISDSISTSNADSNAEDSFSNNQSMQLPENLLEILQSADSEGNSTLAVDIPDDNEIETTKFKEKNSAWDRKPSNESKKQIKLKTTTRETSKLNFTQKLFQSTNFSKRNPRKSLSRTSLNTSLQSSASKFDGNAKVAALPDLETILSKKSKEQQLLKPIATNPHLLGTQKPEEIKTQLEEGWMSRTIDVKVDTSSTTKKDTKQNFGLSNMNLSHLATKYAEKDKSSVNSNDTNINRECSDSDSVVSDSGDESKSPKHLHVLKKRRIMIDVHEKIGIHGTAYAHPIASASSANPTTSASTANPTTSASTTNPTKSATAYTIGSNSSTALPKLMEAASPNQGEPVLGEEVNATAVQPKKTERKRNNRKQSSKNTKKAPVREKRVLRKRAQVGKDKKTEDETNIEDGPIDEEDLKFKLALDGEDVFSVPRTSAKDLKIANEIVDDYIHTNPQKKTTAQRNPKVNIDRELAKKKLEDKIKSGTLNENFVSLNLKKKTFVRGKKYMNYSKYKKKLYKEKSATLHGIETGRSNDGACFTCGDTGHFSDECKKNKSDGLLPYAAEMDEVEDSIFPTLEEAQQMAEHSQLKERHYNSENVGAVGFTESQNNNDQENDPNNQTTSVGKYVGHKIPEDFLKKAGLLSTLSGVAPLYDLNDDGGVKEATKEVYDVLRMFGHDSFRKGQDRAIMRILSGLSTLVTLSTGSGKSLCYQLPAYLYSRQRKAITLVISPLVSLMEDQVMLVPNFLRAHCLHMNQTEPQRLKVLEMIKNGEVDVLMISPEAVVSGESSKRFFSIFRQLPPIAFACIDEVHCVSHWSHNFRPSYLMICKVLRNNLGVKTVLGLTATATTSTRRSIINHLGIHDGEHGIISDIPLPDNLVITVSKDENRDAALLKILNSKRFESCHSIIIYCTKRNECERIAGLIRTCTQDRKAATEETKNKRKRFNWLAEAYHAGLPASRRRTVQKAFIRNELRIVVATIAFGMGINKPDIRAVIHYNMPSCFESYVQETGRSGRDGKDSYCHLFLDAHGEDENELRRFIYANSIDRHVIRKLLQRIYVPCSCRKRNESHACPGHEIGLSIETMVSLLDIPEENISTLLCYMELDEKRRVKILSPAYLKAKVMSYAGEKYLKNAAKDCPPLAMAVALEIKQKGVRDNPNIVEFPVVEIAAEMGWSSNVVKGQLKNLEWTRVNGFPKRSPISVAFSDLGFRVKAPGDFTDEEIDDALDSLYERAVLQEKTQLIQLQEMVKGLSAVAYRTCDFYNTEDIPTDRSEKLKNMIRNYFSSDYADIKLETNTNTLSDDCIIRDINTLIAIYPENNFNGRSIARIFHGISSPNYPAKVWWRCKFWRNHFKVDFNRIVQLANAEIVKRKQ